jgi:hypothetical protein
MKLFIIAIVVFLVGLVRAVLRACFRRRGQIQDRSARSSFVAHCEPTGLAWFQGTQPSHRCASIYSGEATLTPDVHKSCIAADDGTAASLEETDPVYAAAKGIINKELKDIVLHPDKYPGDHIPKYGREGGLKNGKFEGSHHRNLTLHGVTSRSKYRHRLARRKRPAGDRRI